MEGKPTAQTPFPTEDQDKTHFQQIANPPRRIHLMRHAQALHNVPPYNSTLPDPCLTLAGIQQTFSFTHHFLYTDQVSVILTSPMTRTLQTAVLCFPNLARSWSEEDGGTVDIASGHPTQHHHHHQGTKDERSEKKKCKIFAFPELQETSSQPCDTGSPPSHLEAQFADNGVDFSRVKEGWNVKTGIMAADKETVMERAKMSRRELGEWFGGADGGGDVVVVSHAGFLHYLVKSTSPCPTPPKSATPAGSSTPVKSATSPKPSTPAGSSTPVKSATPSGSSTPVKSITPPKSSTPTVLPPVSSPTSSTPQQWQNTEYRTYNLHQADANGEWELVETAESVQRRYMAGIMGAGYGGMGQHKP